MDDSEAVAAVCQLGRELEEGMKTAEAEAELRRWRPMSNGGHDPEYLRQLRDDGVVGGLVPAVLPGNVEEDGINTGGAEKK